jgi:hypothetical protein
MQMSGCIVAAAGNQLYGKVQQHQELLSNATSPTPTCCKHAAGQQLMLWSSCAPLVALQHCIRHWQLRSVQQQTLCMPHETCQLPTDLHASQHVHAPHSTMLRINAASAAGSTVLLLLLLPPEAPPAAQHSKPSAVQVNGHDTWGSSGTTQLHWWCCTALSCC